MDQATSSGNKKMKTSHVTPDGDVDVINKYLAVVFNMTLEDRLNSEDTESEAWFEATQLAWQYMETLDTSTASFRKNFKKHFPSQLTMTKIFKRCGPYLTELILCQKFNCKIMIPVRDYCHNLVHLKLDFEEHDDKYFVNAFSNMNNLKSILFKANLRIDEYGRSTHFCSMSDKKMLQSIHQGIEKISIISNTSHCFFGSDFAATLEKFNALHSLTLHYCSIHQEVIDVIGQKETLRYLSLAESSLPRDIDFTNTKLDNLDHLDVCPAFTSDKFITSIIEKCKKLTYLKLSFLLDISKETLCQFGKLKYLKEISLCVNREVDDEVVAQFQDMKSLGIWSCDKVTDAGIKVALENSPNLEFLGFSKDSSSAVTIESISYAANAAKSRTNNVPLKVWTDRNMIDQFSATNQVPPLLNFSR